MTMLWFHVQIILIAVLASLACVIPGVLLVSRGIALMSDAISHSVLLGIVISFLMFKNLGSPFIFLGAVCASFCTVLCTELIIQSKLLKHDAAVSLVFPLFFSVAVVLISQFSRSVHLDIDMVLVGEIALAPLNQLMIGEYALGSKALWRLFFLIALSALSVGVFFRGFQTVIFDTYFAKTCGYNVTLFHYFLMFLSSITIVVVFDIVGSVMCVALTIVPVATAYIFSKTFSMLFINSIFFALISAILGSVLALFFDVSISGTIATTSGSIFFGIVFLMFLLEQFRKN